MNLNLTGNHLEITPAIRAYVVAKLERVNRHFDHVIDVSVVLSVDKLQQRVEANVHVRGKDIHAQSIEADMYAAIDALADKLDRQVLKHKEKQNDHRSDVGAVTRSATGPTPKEPTEPGPHGHGRRVIHGRDRKAPAGVQHRRRPRRRHQAAALRGDGQAARGEAPGSRASRVAASLAAREKLGSTGLGQGIAIPHGRIKGLSGRVGAFARLRTPIAFDAPDGKPVGAAVRAAGARAGDRPPPAAALRTRADVLRPRIPRTARRGRRCRDGIAALFEHWEPAG